MIKKIKENFTILECLDIDEFVSFLFIHTKTIIEFKAEFTILKESKNSELSFGVVGLLLI